MPITSILEVFFRPDAAEDGLAALSQTLVATREFDGNEGVEVVQDRSDPGHVTVIERWESIEADTAYRAWRKTDEGAPAGDMGPHMSDKPPVLTIYDDRPGV